MKRWPNSLRVAVAGALLLASPIQANADVVLDWNRIMVEAVTAQNPFAQASIAAITQLAVFEAVNAVTGDYTPYLGTVVAPAGASADAAAVAAAHAVLTNYFPGNAAALDARRAMSLAAIPDGTAKDYGVAVGVAAANAMIALRASDGSAPPAFHLPGSVDPGEWQLTPGCPPAGGILRHWGQVTPFGIARAEDFRSDPPPALTSRRYAKDYAEVQEVGSVASADRPDDRTAVARFYAAVLAVGTWNPAATQIAAARGTSLSQNARTLALLNMAISDGLVAVMETKYHYNFWRPYTAVRAGDADGNDRTAGDPAFTPLIATPCFPSYPSAHATASTAARVVLERIFGSGGHDIMLSSAAVPGVVLQYTNLKQISNDLDDARVYGGIHFRFDQKAGTEQGRRIGRYVFTHNLRRANDDDDDDHDR